MYLIYSEYLPNLSTAQSLPNVTICPETQIIGSALYVRRIVIKDYINL